MKFAHFADCHIGSWRAPKMRDASTLAFIKAVDICIASNVDFIIIAGDLFDTALPSIDKLKQAVLKLKEVHNHHIPIYIIAGSHDYSPSGKTMLDVLENAGLVINVSKGTVINNKLKLNFTTDEKTGVKLTGILGKKGMLERQYYESLITDHLEREQGEKIFLFHSAIQELKPKELEHVEVQPMSLLPKYFNYYAGGHVHYIKTFEFPHEGYPMIAYPGALFPNNFSEIEKFHHGGLYIVNDWNVVWQPVIIYDVLTIRVVSEHNTPDEIKKKILDKVEGHELSNTIVTIRVEGSIESGRIHDIGFKEIIDVLYDKGAFCVMKNTNKLISKEFEEITLDVVNVADIEETLIHEHLGQIKVAGMDTKKEAAQIKTLMKALNTEKREGETITTFEERIKSEVNIQ